MFELLSVVFKYIFIFIIYLFIFTIIRLIYLDIKSMSITGSESGAYLKLLNRRDTLPYNVREYYSLEDSLTLGRSNANDIIIKDMFVSNRHLKIEEENNEYYLEDLESSNGTYINDVLVEGVVKLRNGDRVKVGDLEFIFMNRE